MKIQFNNFLFNIKLGKFAIVDMVVHDVNEKRLETALIPDFWLYTFGDKLYCAYPTLKDIKSRNWEKPVKDRQYPGPNWTSWPAVFRRDFGILLFVLTACHFQ